MRRVIILVLAVCLIGAASRFAHANDLTEWMAEQTSGDFTATDEYSREDFEADELADPGSSMRLRMHRVADRGLGNDNEDILSPCGSERSERRRAFCWSSYGRELRLVLPTMAWNAILAFRPRTIYSYKTIDIRFPPSVRVELPFNSHATMGYEDEALGLRFRLKF